MSLEAANREVYLLLKEGITVSVPDRERGGQKTERLRVVDWEQPANNDFLLVSQFSVAGALYTWRPDLVGFVNGLPLVVIELKKPGVPSRVPGPAERAFRSGPAPLAVAESRTIPHRTWSRLLLRRLRIPSASRGP